MNNITKLSLYACNIELNAYGKLYRDALLGHKTVIVSFYALKQEQYFYMANFTQKVAS